MAVVQRRIAAILAADVVGYSRLIGKDEDATLATLKTYREVIDDLIEHHAGRIFGSAGDSVIAEFASPVEAVRCATEIQLAIHKRNADLSEPSRMRFRIGINLGDVVVDGDNLMGDGVNVAARLEALAPPGGICISEAIHAQVRDRLSLDFRDMGEHSMKNIARPVRVYSVPLASEEQIKSPFRGLEVFDFGNADIFFGRSLAIAACIERLEQLAANGTAFLLIYGMSGSGKSSLLRAGLLPAIVRPNQTAGIALWRRCLIRPSEGSSAIASLAAGLLSESALPELTHNRTAAEVADVLRDAPVRVPALIRAALGEAAAASGVATTQARLVLAIDQMEELFTTHTDPAPREALVRLLSALASSGLVWVIGTIRGDYFHRCSEIPGLSVLKDGLGSYELLPPTGPEIAQIIREPARAAGLKYEEDPDRGRLEDVLQEAAIAHRGSLPLLEFVLDSLYEIGRERRLLTFAAYQSLGGLEGAIARRADDVVGRLPNEIQTALPAVLRALTTVRLGDESVTARPALLDDVAATPSQSVLVNALIAARLLVTDENSDGRPVVRLAHEALLSRWPRAKEIADANRNFLETRARIQADTERWVADDKNPDLLLPPGKRLAEGEELLKQGRSEVDDRLISYIETSSNAERARLERERHAERIRIEAEGAATRERLERHAERLEHEAERQKLEAEAATRVARRTRIAAGVGISFGIAAAIGAIVGFRGQQEAVRQAVRAEDSANQAIAARDDALRNQSLSLSFLSRQTAEAGNTEAAVLLGLEALPETPSARDRPLRFEAEAALYGALLKHQQIMVFRHDAGVNDASFSGDGTHIVTASSDKTARVWSEGDGSSVTVLTGHQASVGKAMFSADGDQVLTAADDGTARLWRTATGQQLFVFPQPGNVHRAIFNADGSRVVSVSDAAGPTLWDAQTGRQVVRMQTPAFTASFTPDGKNLATSNVELRTVGVWDAQNGAAISDVFVETRPENLLFGPDGKRTIIGDSYRGEIPSLWDMPSGTRIASLFGHKSGLLGLSFSRDGSLVATASLDGTARLWDALSGELHETLGFETQDLEYPNLIYDTPDLTALSEFSPDDRLLANAAVDRTIRVWDVKSGSLFSIVRGHEGPISRVAFSPDGTRLLTGSHDGTARLWDIDGVLTTTVYHENRPSFVVFSPDGSHLLTGGGSKVANLIDTLNGRKIFEIVSPTGAINLATFSPDGHIIATASQDGKIVMWDVTSGHQLVELPKKAPDVVDLQFSSEGRTLLSSSSDGSVYFWDLSTNAVINSIRAGGVLRQSVLSPDGAYGLTLLSDGMLQLWKINGHGPPAAVGSEVGVTAAAFSPDGRLLVTGFSDGTVRLRPLHDDRSLMTLEGRGRAVTGLAFSKDGQSLATVSQEGAVTISDIATGNDTLNLQDPGGSLSEISFSPNGAYLLTVSSKNRTVRLWSINAGREMALLTVPTDGKIESAATRATFNLQGTHVALVSGDKFARIVRVFPTTQSLIDYAKELVPRSLTPCERKRFYLPTPDNVGICPN